MPELLGVRCRRGVEANDLIVNNRSVDLSEQHQVSTCNVPAGNCGGGFFHLSFQQYLNAGTVGEGVMPYLGANSTCPNPSPTPLRILNWGYVGATPGSPTIREIKLALQNHGPLATAVRATPAFAAYTGGADVFKEPLAGSLNHAVVITGWSDQRGAWRIRIHGGRGGAKTASCGSTTTPTASARGRRGWR